jgi:tetratricopeptide (TPR) repeat protein
MSRGRTTWCCIAVALVAGLAAAQEAKQENQDRPTLRKPDTADTTQPGDVQLPAEEDAGAVPKQYSFNPLQSKKEVTVGEFYLKKGDSRAAAGRFREATKWNDGNSDAWLRLGEAEEKNKDSKAARDAYEKYLKLAPDAKNASEVRKKLEKLKG